MYDVFSTSLEEVTSSRTSVNNVEIKQKPAVVSLHKACRDENVEMVRKILDKNRKAALKYHHTKTVSKFISSKINARDNLGRTALHYAAINNNTTLCKILYKSAKPPNLKPEEAENERTSMLDLYAIDKDGCTPLHYASFNTRAKTTSLGKWEPQNYGKVTHADKYSSAECIRFLVSVSSQSLERVRDVNGQTALHWAVKKDFVEGAFILIFAKYIRENQADKLISWKDIAHDHGKYTLINSKNFVGNTPLHICANHRAIGCANLLMSTGCNSNIKNREGITPLMMAADNGNLEMCRTFAEGVASRTKSKMLSTCDNQGRIALHYSIMKGFNDVTQLLLNEASLLPDKTDFNQEDNQGNTLLLFSAAAGCLTTFVSLLELGADIHKTNLNLSTPLHKAVENGRLENVEELLRRGADINAVDNCGLTPFLVSSYKPNCDILKTVLQHDPNFNQLDRNGDSCIHLAAVANNEAGLKILVAHRDCGSLAGNNNKQGNNALHLAAVEGNLETTSVLLQQPNYDLLYLQNASQQMAVHLAAEKGHTKIVEIIVEKDEKIIVSRDVDNNTPLHLAAKNGHSDTIKYLLSRENCCDAELNDLNQSALFYAAAGGHVKSADLLIDAGFNVNAQDSRKATPLHIAAKSGRTEMIKFLLDDADADISITDSTGSNALDCAIALGGEPCVMSILQSSKWRTALRNLRKLDAITGEITTPMRQLIKFMPNAAKHVLDRCTSISTHENPENIDFKAVFNYEFIEDLYNAEVWKLMNYGKDEDENLKHVSLDCENSKFSYKHTLETNNIINYHPITLMTTSKQSDLLNHPLVETLVDYKWMWFGRKVYFVFMLIYIAFLVSYNVLVLSHIPPYAVKIIGQGSNACFVVQNSYKTALNCTCCIHSDMHSNLTLKVIVALFTVINLTKEGLQLISRKKQYFWSFDNCIEIVTYMSAVLFMIDMSDLSSVTGIKEPWQWIVGSYGIFASWITLALFIRKIPSIGLFVIMLSDVGFSFLRFAGVYLVFVTAFALPYHMLLQNQTVFGTWSKSLVKTFVMTTGEIEFLSLFYPCEESADTNCQPLTSEARVHYSSVTLIFFICFLALMPIIVMNLLVGLAVDDIKSVQENAKHKKMIMKINLALEVEYLLPENIRRFFLRSTLTISPNKDNKRGLFWSMFWDDVTSAHRLHSEILQGNGDGGYTGKNTFAELNKRMVTLHEENQQLKSLCDEILRKLKSE